MPQSNPGQISWEKTDSGWKEKKGFTQETTSELDPKRWVEFLWAKTFSLALLRKAGFTWLGKKTLWVPVNCVPSLNYYFGCLSKRTPVLCDIRQSPYLSGLQFPLLGLWDQIQSCAQWLFPYLLPSWEAETWHMTRDTVCAPRSYSK